MHILPQVGVYTMPRQNVVYTPTALPTQFLCGINYNHVINELETQQKATDNDFSNHTYVMATEMDLMPSERPWASGPSMWSHSVLYFCLIPSLWFCLNCVCYFSSSVEFVECAIISLFRRSIQVVFGECNHQSSELFPAVSYLCCSHWPQALN